MGLENDEMEKDIDKKKEKDAYDNFLVLPEIKKQNNESDIEQDVTKRIPSLNEPFESGEEFKSDISKIAQKKNLPII